MKWLMMVLVVATLAFGSAFCDGFAVGYKDGYRYKETYCFEPFIPWCPMANWGESSWMDGYQRGFLMGLRAKK